MSPEPGERVYMKVGKPPRPDCQRCGGSGIEFCCCGDKACPNAHWSCQCTWVEDDVRKSSELR